MTWQWIEPDPTTPGGYVIRGRKIYNQNHMLDLFKQLREILDPALTDEQRQEALDLVDELNKPENQRKQRRKVAMQYLRERAKHICDDLLKLFEEDVEQ